MIPGKRKLIRKLKRPRNYKKEIKQPQIQLHCADQVQLKHLDTQKNVNHQQNNDGGNDLPPLRVLDIPFKQIAQMTAEERQSLRNKYSNIAKYVFMSQRQKSKYFHQKNLIYRKANQVPGNLPARKIQFKRKFQVKVFDQAECPQAVKYKKIRKQKYNPKVHYG